MADLPSFFTRVDFIGKYLPGYVLVVAYVFLFKSSLIYDTETKLDVDLFTALLFIVAGPALGYTITHFHRSLPYIRNSIMNAGLSGPEKALKKSNRKYADLRTLLSDSEKAELDLAEAEYDFDVSTGLVFLILEMLAIYHSMFMSIQISTLIHVLFIALVACLFINAYFQVKTSVRPLTSAFFRKYKIN